ncbi:MAG: TonB-dependent receptor [Candidatus Korobacteraceae bacterium]|jgi:carboxypeptidase family protein/TonB-dependent receptor-like protein
MFRKLQMRSQLTAQASTEAVPVRRFLTFLVLAFAIVVSPGLSRAQTSGSSSVTGTVADQSGAVVPGATVVIHNPVSQFTRTTSTDGSGKFAFANVPLNPYHMTVNITGFAPYVQDIDIRSAVPLNLKVTLQISATAENITVQGEAGDLVENDPTFHTDVDRNLFAQLPLESTTSALSSLVTLASPGIAADSNGLFHGLGDHAENSFSLDGQPITDQQSKVFSNQIPLDAVQSMTVIAGAPSAEYGDKTSVVIDVTTRSGLGSTTPHGDVTASYGSFGSSNEDVDFSYGGKNWGNFISANVLNTGRFLDPPEFVVMHDKGNEENLFDRVDYVLSSKDALHFNFGFTRSWFQTPNSYDQQFHDINGIVELNPLTGVPLGPTDQRSQILTFNIAPTWTHTISNEAVFNLTGFVRRDAYNYYPSGDPFDDLGAPDLQRQTVAQQRSLLNAGALANITYTKGINNIKAGITYEQTLLNENDQLGIIDPTYNAPCLNSSGFPVNGFTNPSQCAGAGFQPNIATNPNAPNSVYIPLFNPTLLPYDLTRGGTLFPFVGHTDVKELAMYVQDTITKNHWAFNLGIRGDFYNGLTTANQAEPRVGISYNIAKTSTVLRISYARTLETPFNENLILSSLGCGNPVLNPLLACSSTSLTRLAPGYRNEFHAGLQQAFGRYLVIDGEYIWKYTHNAYDFSVLGDTPITFPIEWTKSKIPGFAIRASMPVNHGFSALVVMSSVAARFFTPQVGGAGAAPLAPSGVFRIDHDEAFNQTTHLQYQTPWKRIAPWIGFNWRFDSGLVAGNVPCYGIGPGNDCPQSTMLNGLPAIEMVDVLGIPLTADQEFQAGFTCNGVHATPTSPLPFICPASEFSSTLTRVPAPGTENDDKNPPRIAQRSLFDLSIGDDNLFKGDKYKWSLQFTAINLANNYALYNFLSTFSGTHYVTPRALTAQLGFHF